MRSPVPRGSSARAFPRRRAPARRWPSAKPGSECQQQRVVVGRRGRSRAPLRPCGEAAAGRGGGKLRVERQQHHLRRAPVAHRARRVIAHRVPVAHGDEAAVLRVRLRRPPFSAASSARACSSVSSQQRRAAAEDGVVLRRRLGAPRGDEAAEPGADEARHAQDRGVGEQVLQEGPHASGASGPPRLNSTTATRRMVALVLGRAP